MGRRESSRRTAMLSGLVPVCAALLACAMAVAATPSAIGAQTPAARGAGVTRTSADTNPLANRTWGVYTGAGEQSWTPYLKAHGRAKKLLAKIALAPKAKWYGQWIPAGQITAKVRDHIRS